MKNNTDQLKNFLRQAIHSTPNDFALEQVRNYLKKALDIVESVEEKRHNRQQQIENRKIQTTKDPLVALNVLSVIENELNGQRAILEKIKTQKENQKLLPVDRGDGELQNVFG